MESLEFIKSWTLQEWTAETGMKNLSICEGAYGSFFACGTKRGQVSRNWDPSRDAEETRISLCRNEMRPEGFLLLHLAGSPGEVVETYSW
jgi:hypothetical protein